MADVVARENCGRRQRADAASPVAVARKILWYSYAMVAAMLALIRTRAGSTACWPRAWGAWFLVEARPDAAVPPVHRVPDPAALGS